MAAVNGTAGDDQLYGGDDADTVSGLAGNDELQGGSGNDILNGGDGNDLLNAIVVQGEAALIAGDFWLRGGRSGVRHRNDGRPGWRASGPPLPSPDSPIRRAPDHPCRRLPCRAQ